MTRPAAEGLTPEDMALNISHVTGVREQEPVRALALQLIRAAIVERDREWRDAWAACGHFQEMTACPDACPLRTLLAAGEERTE